MEDLVETVVEEIRKRGSRLEILLVKRRKDGFFDIAVKYENENECVKSMVELKEILRGLVNVHN